MDIIGDSILLLKYGHTVYDDGDIVGCICIVLICNTHSPNTVWKQCIELSKPAADQKWTRKMEKTQLGKKCGIRPKQNSMWISQSSQGHNFKSAIL